MDPRVCLHEWTRNISLITSGTEPRFLVHPIAWPQYCLRYPGTKSQKCGVINLFKSLNETKGSVLCTTGMWNVLATAFLRQTASASVVSIWRFETVAMSAGNFFSETDPGPTQWQNTSSSYSYRRRACCLRNLKAVPTVGRHFSDPSPTCMARAVQIVSSPVLYGQRTLRSSTEKGFSGEVRWTWWLLSCASISSVFNRVILWLLNQWTAKQPAHGN
jgi:hypothetical protein